MALIDDKGNVAIAFALLAPVLLAAAGGAIDFHHIRNQHGALQDAADALATRGAREFLLDNATAAQIKSLVEATAEKQYRPQLGAFDLTVTAAAREKTVTAALSQPRQKGFFLHNLPAYRAPLSVTATAVARGSSNVCVIALEEKGEGAIRADSTARLQAAKCSILSNSTSSRGIDAGGFSKLKAALICSAGGARGAAYNFEPAALTDCPAYDNPLKERLEPDVGPCTHHNLVLGKAGSLSGLVGHTLTAAISLLDGSNEDTLVGYTRFDLQPGVYCGGLRVRGDADVHLAPGIHVVKGGPLEIDLGGRLFGKGVGLFFTGDKAVFNFKPQSIVHLTAPTDGIMAGMLIMENRSRSSTETYSILSANARTLLGTIYLPNGRLLVDSIMPIADDSAYTAIVTRYLRLSGAPQLVLNANYALTDVPVPAGIGASGGQVFLRE